MRRKRTPRTGKVKSFAPLRVFAFGLIPALLRSEKGSDSRPAAARKTNPEVLLCSEKGSETQRLLRVRELPGRRVVPLQQHRLEPLNSNRGGYEERPNDRSEYDRKDSCLDSAFLILFPRLEGQNKGKATQHS